MPVVYNTRFIFWKQSDYYAGGHGRKPKAEVNITRHLYTVVCLIPLPVPLETPRAVEDLYVWSIEPHHVVRALLAGKAVKAFLAATAKLNLG